MPSADTIDKIAHQVFLHCPVAGKPLAALWAVNAFLHLADSRDWSWRMRYGEFSVPDAYSAGLALVDASDPTLIIGSGGAIWTPAMTGRQLRLGSSFPYDIAAVIDPTHLRISLPCYDTTLTSPASPVGYQIVQMYVATPPDFHHFDSVIDPTRNYRLTHGVEKREIDARDPRRVTSGIPYCLAEAGYAAVLSGSIDATPTLALGGPSDPTPYCSGIYTGSLDAVYVVEVTTGGATGTALYRWKKDGGSYLSGAMSSADAVELSDGAAIYWPDGVAYVLGDIFVFRARAGMVAGGPRYEIWPTQLSRASFPYYYIAMPPDLSDITAALPRNVRADVILRGAMAECKSWAGRPGGDGQNPLYNPRDAAADRILYEREIDTLALRDDSIFPKDVTYFREMPFGGGALWDASWEQRHG